MEKHARVLKWVLAVGIVVVLNLLFNFGIMWIYPEPKYEDFCKQEQINIAPDNQQTCVDAGGQWNAGGIEAKPIIAGESVPRGYCDAQFTCRKGYDDATKVYNRNVFVALVVLGVASLAAGFFISVGSVALGFSLGGVLSFIIGAMRYWSAMEGYLRVVILTLALAALVWLGIKKLKE